MHALLLHAALAAPPLPALPIEVEERRLANGIRVAVAQVPTSGLVAVQVRISGGAAAEGPGEAGFAHLLEHLMFGGSAHAPAGAYDRWLAEVGAENNAWTEHDTTTYAVTAPPEALPLVLFLESDRLGWLAEGLEPEALATQQAVVAAEAAGDAAAPHGRDLAALNRAVFPAGHPYHAPVVGDLAQVGAADVPALRRFLARVNAPERVSVSIAGPIAPAAAHALAARWLGEVPAGPPGAPPAPPVAPAPSPTAGGVWVWRDAAREDAVYLAWSTVPRGHPDEPALDLLARALSSGAGAPLPADRRLRRRGLRAVDAWTLNGRSGGLFVVEARLEGGDARSGLAALERAWARAAIDEGRLPALRIRWHADAVRGAQGVDAIAALVGECMGRGAPAGCAQGDLDRYARVSAADLARVRRRWLGDADRTALLVVDPGRPLPAGARPVVLP